MITGNEPLQMNLKEVTAKSIVCSSSNAMGNGIVPEIEDIIYVKPENFTTFRTAQISNEIGRINSELANQKRKYILIGPGRWGSSDSFLGIPVRWDQISNVCLIVETDLDRYMIEPSQGSHFFHNITSFNIGYLKVMLGKKEDFIDWKWLNNQEIAHETQYVRHVHLSYPVEIRIDGRSRNAIITNHLDNL